MRRYDPGMNLPEPPRHDQWKGCAVCGYPLSSFPNGEWGHVTQEIDHLAVPVPMNDLRFNQRCDFCTAETTTHVVLAGTFEIPGTDSGSVGPWAACEVCADLVERHRWSQLVTWVKKNGTHTSRAPRSLLQTIYTTLERHMSDVITVEEWRQRADYPYKH